MFALVTGIPLLFIIAAAILLVIISSARFKINPFLSLLLAAFLTGLVAGIPPTEVIPIITKGFGDMAGAIGLIITLGTLIGVILEESGAAQSIAQAFLRLLGSKQVTLSMSIIGALVGIPVFADSGFIMLQAPGKKLAQQTGINPASITIATATGLMATHVLVPPTPGPLAAAGNLGAEQYLGMVILIGLATAIPAMLTGYVCAKRMPTGISTEESLHAPFQDTEPLELPRFWKSILPILMPLLLIIAGTFLRMSGEHNTALDLMLFLTHPVSALAIGLISGILFLQDNKNNPMSRWMEKAIVQAGPILLVTAAGGAFGAVLKSLPINEFFSQALVESKLKGIWLLPMVFFIAALIKTSQGSSTAALIIVSSLISPLLTSMQIEGAVPLALMVSAIGSGAMVVSHTNDSYFWVVSRFGGLSIHQTLKGLTLTTLWMGLATLATTMLLWWILV